MARLGQLSGFIIAIFLAIALYLFGLINGFQSISALFLFVGLWLLIFGLTAKGGRYDKIYYIGWGSGIGVLSTFVVLPLTYTIGLVLIVVIALIIVNTIIPKRRTKIPHSPTYSKK